MLVEAQEVLDGGPARLREYGIADDEAFEVGLACGGTVGILVAPLDTSFVPELDEAVRADRPIALAMTASGETLGAQRLYEGRLLDAGESALARDGEETVFVHALAPRPALYVFGAIDHAAALVRVGKLLGYRVTVCDARARFVTPERFPEADELVVEWPDRFLAGAPVDERTAICVLTHDPKFDVPVLDYGTRDACRLHRCDGQHEDDRRAGEAAARRRARRRRPRSDPRPDRARDRRSLARGGRACDRRRDRRGDRSRPPRATGESTVSLLAS